MLAAATAHGADAARLASASSMLLFHAGAVLCAVALAERGVCTRNWHAAAFGRDCGKPVRRRPRRGTAPDMGCFPCRADRRNAADLAGWRWL
jgi:hypothetical protein